MKCWFPRNFGKNVFKRLALSLASWQFYFIKAMVFQVVLYGCESWTVKKAECRKIDAFQLWCCRRLLRVPWTARRSNQSVLKEISPGYSLEGLMLKLKLQYFGHLMWRTDSLEKTLMLGKIEGKRRRGWQRMRWLDGTTDSTDMSLGELGAGDGQGGLVFCGPWDHRFRHAWATELNWTALLWDIHGTACKGVRPTRLSFAGWKYLV